MSRDRDENVSTSVSFYYVCTSSHANYFLSSALSDSHYSDFLFDAYNLHTLPDHQKVNSYFSANEASFDYNFRRSKEDSDPNTYQASEIVDSYYGMINWENEKWRYILGYRYEDATVSFRGSQVLIAEDGSYQDTLASIGEKNFGNAFPNAHFRYLWNDNLTIIGSYTETIQRPWYSDIVPSRSIDLQQRFISEGNEDLRPTLYSNWDLSFDIRYSDTAMLSIELFDRSIEDVVFVSRSIISGGEFDGFNLQTKQNSASAENQGIRFTHKQPLDLIPFMPKGLILNTTYTWQDSEIIYPNRPRELLPLPWTSESFIDATLNYDSPHWFFQLKYMHNEPMLARLSSDAWEDAYQIEQERFGLDISYKPDEKRRYFLEITNLLSSPNFENIEGSKFYPIDIRQIPWTARAGIKFEL
ncbi:MAG: TonB-dependent receptor [Verrucomicrobiota bacterium]